MHMRCPLSLMRGRCPAVAGFLPLCLVSTLLPARGAENSALTLQITTPALSRDRTIVADSPSIMLSGTISGADASVNVLWENHRGFSDLAVIEPVSETNGETGWRTRASIPLRPGLNQIIVKAFDRTRATQTSVNVLWPVAGTAAAVPPLHTGFYRGRPVTYEVVNGRAIYQGDIVLGAAADLDAARPSVSAAGPHVSTSPVTPESATIAYAQYLWPKVGGVAQVPYTVSARDQAVSSTYDNIKAAVSEFNTQLSGIIQYVAASGSKSQYVEFDFNPSDENGVCDVTSVGYQTSPVPLVIGGAINCPVSTMLHEMGHIIGLWHEQSRTDRNNYVNFLYANVDKPNASNFDQLTDNEVAPGLYNYASIMHYVPFAFSRDGVSPTLESIPAGIPLSSTMPQYTTGDLDGIKRLYGHAPTAVTIDTNPAGLQVIVDGATVTAPQTYTWTLGSQHTLSVASGAQTLLKQNYIFARWNTLSTAATQTITVAAGNGSLLQPLTSPAITNYLANFIPIHVYSPNVYPAGKGTITASPAPGSISIDGKSINYYEDRQKVTLTVSADAPYTFYDWYEADLLNYYSNPYTFYVLNDLSTLQSVLVADAVTTLSAASPDIGATGTFPGFAIVVDDASTYAVPRNFDNTYDGWASGQKHTLCGTSLVSGACPSSGLPSQSPVTTNITYAFHEWSGSAGTQTSNSLPIQVNGNQTFTANYTPSFRVIVLPSPYCGGSITPSTPGEPYLDTFLVDGSSQSITATPVSGLSFVGWSQDMSGTTNPDDLAVSGQLLGTANFNSPGTTAPLAISSFTPASVAASGSPQDVMIRGSGFTNNTSVTYTYFNGKYRNHAYVSPTQLIIELQAGDIATPGYYPIEVFNVGGSQCGVSVQSPFAILTDPPPAPSFTISKTHSGNFSQGQDSAEYTVAVTNSGTAATSGAVTVTDTIPSGLTLVSMSGTGWTCPSGDNTCTRSDALNAGTAYPAITVTVDVSKSAASPQVNEVSVSGGGAAAAASTSNSTVITQVPASIAATAGTPQSATINTAFAVALQATVKDAGGKPVPGVTVTFSAPATGAGATLSSGEATTNSSGVASVTATANGTGGSYTVTATVGGVSTGAAFSLTNNP